MLTYLDQCGWCSTSISSTICPSNVGKSTVPCPILSSSLASTSSISNSDSISLDTDSISSYGRRTRASTSIVHSSLGHPNDYYTTKRIDDLHERMDDIQISSFLKFINYHLSLKHDNDKLHINDLVKDLSNGHVLIDLIEILSSTKLKREHGRTRFHSLTNIQYVLDYLKLRMQHINISPHEIVSGNRKQILALLWIIMKTFDFSGFRITNKNCYVENTLLGFGQDRSVIIKWLNHILNQCLTTQKISIKDFYIQTWINGYYLSLIIKYLIPLSIKYLTIKSFDYLKELDEVNPSDKQRFQICLNLSNYCFNTLTIIDYTDKSEKCLFKYFTELQQNVFIMLKTNQIGKLIQNNPYTKQILDTISQTTEHSSHIINGNDQYLVCIKDDKQEILAEKKTRLTLNSMGHSTSSDDTDELLNLRTVEKSRLFNDEQEKMKLKRRNRWEKTENLQSNSHLLNGHTEKQTEIITGKPQQLNDTVEEIEQKTNDQIKLDRSIVATQNLEQFTSTVEQSTVADEETEQMIVTNVENQLDEKLENLTIEIQESRQVVISNEESNQSADDCKKSEQITKSKEEIEQPIENKISAITDEQLEHPNITIEEPAQSVIFNDKLEKSVIEESHQQEQPIISNEVDKQSMHEYEELVKNESSFTKIEQLTAAIDEEEKQFSTSNERIEPLKQIASTTTIENESSLNINEKSEQCIVEMEESQPPITLNEQNNKSTVEHDKLEQLTNEESLEPLPENQEITVTPVENNHYIVTSEKSEQPTIEGSSQSVLSNKENDQNAMKVIDNETSFISNGVFEQLIVNVEETKQFIIKNKRSDQSSAPITKAEQLIEHKPSITTNTELEEPIFITSDKKTEQTPVTIVKNTSITINNKLEQSPQTLISNEKTTAALVENNYPIMTSKKLEKPVVIESQLPIVFNEEIDKSTITNKKSIATTKKSTQTASSVQENPHSTPFNKQLTQSSMTVKEPEKRKVVVEQPVQTTATTLKGSRYSDAVNKQLPKTKNESIQPSASFKKQEHSTVPKNKAASPIISIEKPQQPFSTAEEIEQVPFINTVKESEVSLEKQEKPITVIEEPCASPISNEEPKKSSTKNKKSRRSNAKKGKAKNSSVKTENPPQPVVNTEEEDQEEDKVEPLLPPLNLTNIESEIQNPSTTPKTSSNNNTSINNGNPPNSSALQSRKNKKKKTIATTTTTLIEKASSPIIPTAPTRNLFIVIKECLRDRKIIAFKCVFILICLCFSIIIIVLSHK